MFSFYFLHIYKTHPKNKKKNEETSQFLLQMTSQFFFSTTSFPYVYVTVKFSLQIKLPIKLFYCKCVLLWPFLEFIQNKVETNKFIQQKNKYFTNCWKGSNKQLGFTQSNQLYFHRVIKVINFAVQLHFLILIIIMACRENSMPIIIIIKIKTANLIIRKRGENNLYHFPFFIY